MQLQSLLLLSYDYKLLEALLQSSNFYMKIGFLLMKVCLYAHLRVTVVTLYVSVVSESKVVQSYSH